MDIILRRSLPKLREKLLEALQAVLPIVAIVLVLCFTVAPVSPSILLCFLLGAAMIVVGIMFFTLGAEMSMTPMGERVGAVITRSRKLPLILVLGFLLGFLITISEPDLQVLADQVPSIPSGTLILSVAAGVACFWSLPSCVCSSASRCQSCWCCSMGSSFCWRPLCPRSSSPWPLTPAV